MMRRSIESEVGKVKHTIMFSDKETGKTIGISSKIFEDMKELHVIEYDDSSKSYREREIEVIQQEENNKRH